MELIRSFFAYLGSHFFSISIFLLLTLLVGASYVRFELQNDYLISFEGECDPYTQLCFEGCEDDECEEVYYYSIIERHAAETYELCGTGDVLECDAAWECEPGTPGVSVCEVTYCDPAIDGEDTCMSLTEEAS